MALDAKLRIKLARAQRYQAYDTKRKNMVEELEESERAFKKAKMDQEKEKMARWQATERIKEEGRKMREEREKELRVKTEHQEEDAELEAPVLGRFAFQCCGWSLTVVSGRPFGYDRSVEIQSQGTTRIDD